MNLAEHREMAEELGKAQMTPADACVILEVSEKEFTDSLWPAYRKGQLKAKFVVQLAVYEMARQGAAPAQKQFLELAEVAGSFVPDGEPEDQE